ncbi:Breast cancer 2, early onset [Quaeritorhiza haematococci]|nr:Breast cancer 2, early onset [Quaeritorhiza haematococci]
MDPGGDHSDGSSGGKSYPVQRDLKCDVLYEDGFWRKPPRPGPRTLKSAAQRPASKLPTHARNFSDKMKGDGDDERVGDALEPHDERENLSDDDAGLWGCLPQSWCDDLLGAQTLERGDNLSTNYRQSPKCRTVDLTSSGSLGEPEPSERSRQRSSELNISSKAPGAAAKASSIQKPIHSKTPRKLQESPRRRLLLVSPVVYSQNSMDDIFNNETPFALRSSSVKKKMCPEMESTGKPRLDLPPQPQPPEIDKATTLANEQENQPTTVISSNKDDALFKRPAPVNSSVKRASIWQSHPVSSPITPWHSTTVFPASSLGKKSGDITPWNDSSRPLDANAHPRADQIQGLEFWSPSMETPPPPTSANGRFVTPGAVVAKLRAAAFVQPPMSSTGASSEKVGDCPAVKEHVGSKDAPTPQQLWNMYPWHVSPSHTSTDGFPPSTISSRSADIDMKMWDKKLETPSVTAHLSGTSHVEILDRLRRDPANYVFPDRLMTDESPNRIALDTFMKGISRAEGTRTTPVMRDSKSLPFAANEMHIALGDECMSPDLFSPRIQRHEVSCALVDPMRIDLGTLPQLGNSDGRLQAHGDAYTVVDKSKQTRIESPTTHEETSDHLDEVAPVETTVSAYPEKPSSKDLGEAKDGDLSDETRRNSRRRKRRGRTRSLTPKIERQSGAFKHQILSIPMDDVQKGADASNVSPKSNIPSKKRRSLPGKRRTPVMPTRIRRSLPSGVAPMNLGCGFATSSLVEEKSTDAIDINSSRIDIAVRPKRPQSVEYLPQKKQKKNAPECLTAPKSDSTDSFDEKRSSLAGFNDQSEPVTKADEEEMDELPTVEECLGVMWGSGIADKARDSKPKVEKHVSEKARTRTSSGDAKRSNSVIGLSTSDDPFFISDQHNVPVPKLGLEFDGKPQRAQRLLASPKEMSGRRGPKSQTNFTSSVPPPLGKHPVKDRKPKHKKSTSIANWDAFPDFSQWASNENGLGKSRQRTKSQPERMQPLPPLETPCQQNSPDGEGKPHLSEQYVFSPSNVKGEDEIVDDDDRSLGAVPLASSGSLQDCHLIRAIKDTSPSSLTPTSSSPRNWTPTPVLDADVEYVGLDEAAVPKMKMGSPDLMTTRALRHVDEGRDDGNGESISKSNRTARHTRQLGTRPISGSHDDSCSQSTTSASDFTPSPAGARSPHRTVEAKSQDDTSPSRSSLYAFEVREKTLMGLDETAIFQPGALTEEKNNSSESSDNIHAGAQDNLPSFNVSVGNSAFPPDRSQTEETNAANMSGKYNDSAHEGIVRSGSEASWVGKRKTAHLGSFKREDEVGRRGGEFDDILDEFTPQSVPKKHNEDSAVDSIQHSILDDYDLGSADTASPSGSSSNAEERISDKNMVQTRATGVGLPNEAVTHGGTENTSNFHDRFQNVPINAEAASLRGREVEGIDSDHEKGLGTPKRDDALVLPPDTTPIRVSELSSQHLSMQQVRVSLTSESTGSQAMFDNDPSMNTQFLAAIPLDNLEERYDALVSAQSRGTTHSRMCGDAVVSLSDRSNFYGTKTSDRFEKGKTSINVDPQMSNHGETSLYGPTTSDVNEPYTESTLGQRRSVLADENAVHEFDDDIVIQEDDNVDYSTLLEHVHAATQMYRLHEVKNSHQCVAPKSTANAVASPANVAGASTPRLPPRNDGNNSPLCTPNYEKPEPIQQGSPPNQRTLPNDEFDEFGSQDISSSALQAICRIEDAFRSETLSEMEQEKPRVNYHGGLLNVTSTTMSGSRISSSSGSMNQPLLSGGFATARGAKVEISKEALEAAEKLFEDDGKESYFEEVFRGSTSFQKETGKKGLGWLPKSTRSSVRTQSATLTRSHGNGLKRKSLADFAAEAVNARSSSGKNEGTSNKKQKIMEFSSAPSKIERLAIKQQPARPAMTTGTYEKKRMPSFRPPLLNPQSASRSLPKRPRLSGTLAHHQATTFVDSMFKTGSGKALPPLSAAALRKAEAMMSDQGEDIGTKNRPEKDMMAPLTGAKPTSEDDPSPSADDEKKNQKADTKITAPFQAHIIVGRKTEEYGDDTAKMGDPSITTPPTEIIDDRMETFSSDSKHTRPTSEVFTISSAYPNFSGFTTAGGKPLPPISDAAMARAWALLADEENGDELTDQAGGSITNFEKVPAPVCERQVTEHDAAHRADFVPHESNLFGSGADNTLGFGGFTTASGKTLPPIPDTALRKARALFADKMDADESVQQISLQIHSTNMEDLRSSAATHEQISKDAEGGEKGLSGFMTGAGKPLPPISEAAFERACALLADDGVTEKSMGQTAPNATNIRDIERLGKGPEKTSVTESELAGMSTENAMVAPGRSEPGDFLRSMKSARSDKSGFGGFTTAAGKPLPPISDAASERARVFFEVEVERSEPTSTESTATTWVEEAQVVVEDGVVTHRQLKSDDLSRLGGDTASSKKLEFPLFTTGAGKPLPPLSDGALKRARALFADDNVGDQIINHHSPPKADAINNRRTARSAPNPRKTFLPAFKAARTFVGDEVVKREDSEADCFSLSPTRIADSKAELSDFKTGSGKVLPPISEAARKKARALVEAGAVVNTSSDDPQVSRSSNQTILSGFTTGSGKALPPVSEAALNKARTLFEAGVAVNPLSDDPQVSTTSNQIMFSGFTTGSGKAIPPVSEAALKKACALFEGEANVNGSSDDPQIPASSSHMMFSGFTKGSGKALPPVSEAALNKARALFEDRAGVDSWSDDPQIPASSGQMMFSGFTTGSGKAIPPVSEAALKKACALFEGEANVNGSSDDPQIPVSSSHTMLSGFTTGSGKAIPPVSEAALNKARALFEDGAGVNSRSDDPQIAVSSSQMMFSGFTTGSGKAIPPVSEAALKKACALFEGEANVNGSSDDPQIPVSSSHTMLSGFTTGSGKAIPPVSEAALNKARALYKDGADVNGRSDDPQIAVSSSQMMFSGFTTGSGKAIPPVSEAALKKACALFEDEANVIGSSDDPQIPVSSGHTMLSGFTTASGKVLPPVSEAALKKARALFEGEANVSGSSDDPQVPTSSGQMLLSGFTTGSGKSLPPVSERSLKRARALLEDSTGSIVHPNEVMETKDSPDSKQGGCEKAFDEVRETAMMNIGTTRHERQSNFIKGMAEKSSVIPRDTSSEETEKRTTSVFAPRTALDNAEDSALSRESRLILFAESGTARKRVCTALEVRNSRQAPTPATLPPFSGFITGAGKALPPVSKEAMKRARTTFADDISLHEQSIDFVEFSRNEGADDLTSLMTAPERDPPLINVQPMKRALNVCDESGVTVASKPETEWNNLTSTSNLCGFTTATGKSLPSVSKASMKKALALFDVESFANESSESTADLNKSPGDQNSNSVQAHSIVPPADVANMREVLLTGFKTGTGKDLPAISEKSLKRAQVLFDDAPLSFSAIHEDPNSSATLNIAQADQHSKLEPCASLTTFEEKGSRIISKCALEQAKSFFSTNPTDVVDRNLREHKPVSSQELSKPDAHNISSKKHPFKTPFKKVPGSTLTTADRTPLSRCLPLTSGRGTKPLADRPSSSWRVPQTPLSLLDVPTPVTSRRTGILNPLSTPLSGDAPHTIERNHMLAKPADSSEKKASALSGVRTAKGVNGTAASVFSLEVDYPRKKLHDLMGKERQTVSAEELMLQQIPVEIISMTPSKAAEYKFVVNESLSKWDKTSARNDLIASGAKPELATEEWVENHYKWIVWKVAGMARSFPRLFAEYCNPQQVCDQLKYRYEREINRVQRSSLKLIIERDDAPSRFLVLCVSRIFQRESIESPTTEAGTGADDGWYKINAQLDKPLADACSQRKVFMGQKLSICGAQLIGSPDACPALEVPDSTMLRLNTNGTRRARWDAKLGYQRAQCFFMETLPDGTRIFRNEKEEEAALLKWQNDYETEMQRLRALFEKNPQEFMPEQSKKKISMKKKPGKAQDVSTWSVEQLYAAMQSAADPYNFLSSLNESQQRHELLSKLKEGKRFKVRKLVKATRNILEYIKLIQFLLSMQIYNAAASRHRGRLSLRTSKNAIFREIQIDEESISRSLYLPRKVLRCDDVNGYRDEFDIVVIIIGGVRESPSGSFHKFEQLLVCTDDTRTLVGINITFRTTPHTNFEVENIIVCRNLKFTYFDSKFRLSKLRADELSEIYLHARGAKETAVKQHLQTWLTDHPQTLSSLVAEHDDLLSQIADGVSLKTPATANRTPFLTPVPSRMIGSLPTTSHVLKSIEKSIPSRHANSPSSMIRGKNLLFTKVLKPSKTILVGYVAPFDHIDRACDTTTAGKNPYSTPQATQPEFSAIPNSDEAEKQSQLFVFRDTASHTFRLLLNNDAALVSCNVDFQMLSKTLGLCVGVSHCELFEDHTPPGSLCAEEDSPTAKAWTDLSKQLVLRRRAIYSATPIQHQYGCKNPAMDPSESLNLTEHAAYFTWLVVFSRSWSDEKLRFAWNAWCKEKPSTSNAGIGTSENSTDISTFVDEVIYEGQLPGDDRIWDLRPVIREGELSALIDLVSQNLCTKQLQVRNVS